MGGCGGSTPRPRSAPAARPILAGACLEGILSSSAPVVAVMDGDLQHDETRLSAMLAIMRSGEADMVIGDREASEGTVAVRKRSGDDLGARPIAAFIDDARAEVAGKA